MGDVLRWMRERRRHPRPPDRSTFTRAVPTFPVPRAGADVITATWVGHSTVLLQVGGLNILTDPVWSERASPVWFAGPRRRVPPAVRLDALPPLDVVLLSHDHYDHLDRRTVRALAAAQPAAVWCVPLGVGALVRRFGVRQVSELDWWDETGAAGATVGCTPAQHFSGRGIGDRGDRLWCGWVVIANGRRVFFAGDTALHPEFGRIAERWGPFDLVLLPIGAYEPRWFMRAVHMNPDDAMAAYRALAGSGAPPLMVPIHWGTFKLTDEPMDEPARRFREQWQAAGLAGERLWLLAHGETRALPPRRVSA